MSENGGIEILHTGKHDCFYTIYAAEGDNKLNAGAIIRCPCGRAWRLQRGTGLLRWAWSNFHCSRYSVGHYWFPAPSATQNQTAAKEGQP